MPKKSKKQNNPRKKPCPLAEEDNLYAKVIKLLGNCRMTVLCSDKKERLAHVRGSLQKRVWIRVDDIVLVSVRTFQELKCDIVYKYSADQVSMLTKQGQIPRMLSSFKKIEVSKNEPIESVWKDDDDDGFVFEDDIDVEKI